MDLQEHKKLTATFLICLPANQWSMLIISLKILVLCSVKLAKYTIMSTD